MKKLSTVILLAFLSIILAFIGCSKGGGTTTPPPNPCTSRTIVVTGTTTPTSFPGATNGSISASASGSSGFTFSLNGGASQASGTFSGLAAGNYTITAKDGDGCTGSQTFTVTATPCPTITVTATITQTSSPTATNGAIAATASGSTGFTYSINGIAGTYQASGTFSNLTVGSYTIHAKDVNGCIGSASFSVTAITCPTITLTATPTNASGPTATNGSISASASGGAAPYTFSRNGGAFQASGTFSGLAPGSYGIVAKDNNGCLSATSNVTVGVTCPTITSTTTTTPSDKCANNTGSVTITAMGSTGFTYSKDAGVTFQVSNVFNQLPTGTLNYIVKDGNGCTVNGNANVAIAPAGTLFSAVKAVMVANCVSCHGGPFPQNGLDFNDDCTIVTQKDRIKARAVDFSPSQMPPAGPPISTADRQKIVDWINAGGRHSN